MFRLEVNVLSDADLKTATKLIIEDAAADSARDWKSDVVSQESSTGRWICKSPEILAQLFKLIAPRIYDMNAPNITPEVLDEFIYWMDLKEVAHVDGNPGTKGFVAVLSVGASAVLYTNISRRPTR